MWRTLDIVPSSIRNDPQVQAACATIDVELRQMYDCMSSVPGGILFWPFVNQQMPPMLDVLAWEMHVDIWQGWEGDLSIEKKRQLIDESIEWHRHKGTKWIVERMLKLVFTQGYVTEWYTYGGDPYYFRIITEEEIADPERIVQVIEAIYAVKNVRSWLDGFIRAKQSRLDMYEAIVAMKMIQQFVPVSTNSHS